MKKIAIIGAGISGLFFANQLKNNSERRSAELLASSLVQLLSGGNHSEIIEQVNQSMRWLKQEIKAPSCSKN